MEQEFSWPQGDRAIRGRIRLGTEQCGWRELVCWPAPKSDWTIDAEERILVGLLLAAAGSVAAKGDRPSCC